MTKGTNQNHNVMSNVLVKKIFLIALTLTMMGLANAQSISYNASYDLSAGLSFDDNLLIGSQVSLPQGMSFNDDGTRLFVVGSGEVNQYTLSNPYLVDAGNTHDGAFSTTNEESTPVGIAFSNDGMKMFIVGSTSDLVVQYSLTSAYDITSSISVDGTYNVNSFNVTPSDILFNDTGDKMYICGLASVYGVDQFDLSTPFDITSTITHEGNYAFGFSFRAYGMAFNEDGTTLFTVSAQNDEVAQYTLSTPYDVTSTVTKEQAIFDVSSQDTSPTGIAFNGSGTMMYVVGDQGNDISQYIFNAKSFVEGPANDGQIGNTVDIHIDGETFTNSGGTLTSPTNYSISGIPTGLGSIMNISSDGKKATLSLTGNANAHQDTNDVSDLIFTFNNSAFTGGNAAGVSGAIAQSSQIAIDFNDNYPIVSYGHAYDLLNGAIRSGEFDVTSEEGVPQGIVFSNDGLKMYIVGREATEVNQYSLTSPFNINSGVSFDGSPLDISGEVSTANDIAFSSDGATMFIVDQSTREIEQYSLTTPWDITGTVTNTGSPFSFIAHESAPGGLAFNPSGTKMFIVGFVGDRVNQFSLQTPFDVSSGVSHDGFFGIATEEGNSSAIAFSIDGLQMYITGSTSDDFHKYALDASYDITQGVTYEGSLIGPSGTPTGITFSTTGDRFFSLDDNSNTISQWTVNTGSFFESATNDGAIVGSFAINIVDDKFSNAGGTLTNGFDYSIFGLPSGLTPNIAIAADGLSATFTISGNANNHQDSDDFDEILLTFNNSAFVGGDASVVTNATSASTNWGIDFRSSNPELIYGNAYDLSASINSNVGYAAGTGFTQGFDFSADGTKLFIIGSTNDNIIQYTLSAPYDLSTAPTANGSPVSVAAQETTPTGIAFSNDGMKMIVSGTDSDMIQQYTLSSAFDITAGITPDGSSINGIVNPNGICYSTDGSILFVITSNEILPFKLSTSYDISTAESTGASYNFSSETTNGQGLSFSKDGSKMFISGSGGSYQYSLNIPFEISSGVTYEVTNTSGSTLYDFKFSENGKSYFNLNSNGVSQQDLIQNDFIENVENVGTVDGSLNILLLDEIFNNSGGSLTYSTDYSISGLPAGLTPSLSVDSDGKQANLTFGSNANTHQYANSLSDLQFTFNNSAFNSGDASSVSNASSASSETSLTFLDNVPRVVYGDAFELGNIQSGFTQFIVNVEEDTPLGVAFNNDGTKMFIIGSFGDDIDEYNLSTPYEVTSATFSGNKLDVSVEEGLPVGMAFSRDGSKLFVCGLDDSNGGINQYTLSTPFDITTASHDGEYASNLTSSTGFTFNANGTKMYVVGPSSMELRQFTLSVPFDVTAEVVYDGVFGITEGSYLSDVAFNWDGSKCFILDNTSDAIYQYSLTTPFDFSGGFSYDNVSFSTTATSPNSMTFDPSGTKMFILGSNFKRVYQYTINPGNFTEVAANDGNVEGSIQIQITDDEFTNAGGSLIFETDYQIDGLPVGLTPSMVVAGDGKSATISITGSVSDHQNADDVSSLEFTLENSAFVNSNATDVINAVSSSTRVGIDFEDNKVLIYGHRYDISNGLSYNGASYTSGTSEPYGITFNNDGTIMYYIDQRSTQRVYQYSLAHPYQLSGGVTSDGGLAITGETQPRDVVFSSDGSKMFVVGQSSDAVHEYTLNTPFDITDGWTHEGSISAGTNPRAMAFSSNGTRMFILAGSSSVSVSTYQLSEPYNIQSRTAVGGFSVTATSSSPAGLEFSNDGYKMFILDSNADAILQYTLENSFNTSSGVTYDGISTSLPYLPGGLPFGLAINGDGTSFYVADYWTHYIRQYDISQDGFKELSANDGSVDGFATARLTGGLFSSPGGTLNIGSDYTLNSIPSGLTPSLSVSADAKAVTLTLSGNADAHQDANDVDDIAITFLNGAFSDNDASGVTNPTGNLNAGIDFRDNNPAITYGHAFNPFEAVYTSTNFHFGDEEQFPQGVAFNNDGSKMYMVGYNESDVFQYTLATPYDISTASYDAVSFDVGGQETRTTGIAFNPSGSAMFIVGSSDGMVNQYTLSTPYDISSASFSKAYDPSAYAASHGGIAFNNDGSKMYLIGGIGLQVNQFSLDVPYDITSVDHDGFLSITSYGNNPTSVTFSGNGKWLIFSGSITDRIRMFELDIPFDVTSNTTYVDDIYVWDIDPSVHDVLFKPDGTKMYMVGSSNKNIYEFEIDLGTFDESSKNDGGIDDGISVPIYITDERFSNAGGSLTHGADFTISNLPTGLTPSLVIDAGGQEATLSLAGSTDNHQDVNDVDDLIFTFTNSAFVGGNAASVTNASAASSSLSVDFRDNHPVLKYGNGFDLEAASYSGNSFNVSTEDGYITGLAFNNDGTKVFVSGNNNNQVFEYDLSEPYNLSGSVSYSGNSLNISTDASSPEDIYFSQDGTRLFILSNSNYEVVQYNLSVAFDLSSATYSGNSFSVEAQDDSPYGLTFSTDGSQMFVSGADSYAVNQYALSTAFDISTASFSIAFSVENDEESPSGIAFSPNGRYMIVVGDNDSEAIRYTLNVPFDLTMGANLDAAFLDLSIEDSYPTGIAISPDGNRLLTTGSENNLLYQYNIDLGGFSEVAGNDGSVDGELNIYVIDEIFSNAGGSLTHGVDYTINNLPAGFTPVINIDVDGYSATLTLSGSADLHGEAQDISGLEFNFSDTVFPNFNASAVANAVNHDSKISVDFLAYTGTDILTFELAEQTGPATIDNGESSTVTVEVVAGTDISALTPTIMVSQSATVSPASGVEQDFTTSVTYTVTAEDGGEADMEVTVTEALATPTDIILSSASINENGSINDVVGDLSSVDASFDDTHTYTLIAGTGDADNASFNVNGSELRASESFDFETKSSYNIRIQTDDNNGGLFEKAFIISISDVNEVPTDITLDNNSINESNPSGTAIGALTTTDEDQGQSYTYTLVSGTGDTDNTSFNISGSELVSAEVFDFESKNSYSVRIQTNDGNGGTYAEAFTITINDLPASITSVTLDNNTVDENEASGTLVGSLSTFGEDLTGSYTYALASGTGDDDNGSFNISGDQLLTSASFDFEVKSNYTVRIMTDDGNLSESFAISIDINDVNEAPTDITLSGSSIAENNAIGDAIGTLTTDDEDNGQSFTYSLVSGSGDTDNASFVISGDQLQANTLFDFETKSSYSVRIETNDGNGGTYQEAFTISITDENESILVSNPIADLNLDETFGSTTIDLTNVFTDQDGDALTYSVQSSNTSVVTVNNSGVTLTISEVGIGMATVTVTADDGSGVTTSDEFTVTVNDINFAPVVANAFPDGFSAEEGFGTTQVNYTDVFSDPDGDNLTISVTSSDQGVVTASVIANNQIQITEVGIGESTITVTANDGNGGSVSDTFTFTVTAAPLGFEDNISLEVYPNPATDFVNIKSTTDLMIQLTDLRGQAIQSGKGQTIRMDMRDLRSGVYILKISNGESISYKRIIKAN